MARNRTSRAESHRNVIICCDGTGNEVGVNLSNVLKLYRILEKNEGQRVFYDPGVGTIARLATWGRLRQKFKEVIGLSTGYGLDENITDAYRYLCQTYEDGDRIFLFGFSRGSYTVRALAGMIHLIGLLRPDQLNLIDYALTAYKRASESHDLSIAWQFQRITAGRDVPIHFIGVWDTVASVIVPRPDRLYWPSLQFLPYTKKNDSVRTFRQACAIDERRAMFRLYRWTDGQAFKPTRFWKGATIPQDSKQVWFAGVHADVGGGYPEQESALSKYPLLWMLEEAQLHGAQIDGSTVDHLVFGKPRTGSAQTYVAPDPGGKLHRSLTPGWMPLEIVPKAVKWRRWPGRRSFLGLYLPLAEPRLIPERALIHQSVLDRKEAVADYRPINLPQDYAVEPHRTRAQSQTEGARGELPL